jgi:tRNA(adenine34) deaminase
MSDHLYDERWMKIALKEAKRAFQNGEVPVGAIIVKGEEVIAKTHNLCEKEKDATSHAELLAIRKGSRRVGRWGLVGSTIFVTLEPCPMCKWAIRLARISRIVYGCSCPSGETMRSTHSMDINEITDSNLIIKGGVLEKECSELIRLFFKNVRKKNS